MDVERGENQREVFTDSPAWVKSANHEVRMGFVRKVYVLLMVQLLLTTAVAAPFHAVPVEWLGQHLWLLYASSVLSLVLVCAMTCFRNVTRSFPANYILLLCFTACEGVLIGFVSATYTATSVVACLGITVLIFGVLTAYAWKTKTDFTGFGPYLYGVLISLILFSICMGILRFAFGVNLTYVEMAYDIGCILLFVIYIIFDTQLIIGGEHKHQFTIDDYVLAAMSLYLDIINLFIHLLRLFGQRR